MELSLGCCSVRFAWLQGWFPLPVLIFQPALPMSVLLCDAHERLHIWADSNCSHLSSIPGSVDSRTRTFDRTEVGRADRGGGTHTVTHPCPRGFGAKQNHMGPAGAPGRRRHRLSAELIKCDRMMTQPGMCWEFYQADCSKLSGYWSPHTDLGCCYICSWFTIIGPQSVLVSTWSLTFFWVL